MNILELKRLVIAEYNNRNLKSSQSYKELDKIIDYLRNNYGNELNHLPKDKNQFKREYCDYLGKEELNGAESSVINEIFYQLTNQNGKYIPSNPILTKVEENKSKDRDEDYVIDLCDNILGEKASRQHRFPFLVGDSGSKLPVDAYYPNLNLVIEYYERQHTENVSIFNRKITVSNVERNEQRRIYDERRKKVLPEHGIKLVIINYSDFDYDNQKRIKRNFEKDLKIVSDILKNQ